jgi:DNA processing protein
MNDEERIARAELTWIAEPGDQRLGGLVRVTGAVRTMTLIRAGRITAVAGLDPAWDVQRAVDRWHSALKKIPPRGEIERALGGRFRLVHAGCAEWPDGLDGLGDAAPIALWATGVADLRFSCLRSVAVVGARAATAYGSYMAADLAASVAARGWTVISGGAFGIDAAAHRGALGSDAWRSVRAPQRNCQADRQRDANAAITRGREFKSCRAHQVRGCVEPAPASGSAPLSTPAG